MTTPKVVSPRGTEDGKIFLYTSDSATKAELQSGLDIAGLQGVEVEFTNDEDELIGDEEKKDIYSRNIGVMLTVAHACINLETLAALLNTTFSESGTSPNEIKQTTFRPANAPWFMLAGLTGHAGEQAGAFLIRAHKIKISSLSIKLQRGSYLEVSFVAKGKASLFGGDFLDVEGHESGDAAIDEFSTFYPTLVELPLFAPDTVSGASVAGSVNGNFTRGLRYDANALNEYWEWENVFLGAGSHKLMVQGNKLSSAPQLTLRLDGVSYGYLDFYDASSSYDTLELVFDVPADGYYTVRLAVEGKNASSSSYNGYFGSAVIARTASAASLVNTLPGTPPKTTVIPPEAFTDSLGTVLYIGPAGSGGNQVEQTGLGEYLEYKAMLEPGTYSIEAMLEKTSDSGVLAVYADGVLVGQVDLYNASTVELASTAIPGSFTVAARGQVTIKLLTSSTNQTGYRKSVGWIYLKRTADGAAVWNGDSGPHEVTAHAFAADTYTNWNEHSYAAKPGNYRCLSTGSQASELVFDKFPLTKGRYRLTFLGQHLTNGGNMHVIFDGEDLTQFDTYDAAASGDLFLSAEVEIAESKTAELKFTASTKNASSAGYQVSVTFVHFSKISE